MELKALPRLQRVGAKPRWPELESKVMEWVLDKHMNGIGLSGTMIELKAELMAQDMPGRGLYCFYHVVLSFHEKERLGCKEITQRLPQEFEDNIIIFQ